MPLIVLSPELEPKSLATMAVVDNPSFVGGPVPESLLAADLQSPGQQPRAAAASLLLLPPAPDLASGQPDVISIAVWDADSARLKTAQELVELVVRGPAESMACEWA